MKFKDILNESFFKNWTEIVGNVDFAKFIKNYKKIDKKNVVKKKRRDWYGFKKGSNKAEWKYVSDEFKLYSDLSDKEVYKILSGK